MPDDNSPREIELQNIFEPEINARQRRIAVRYDALRMALGKAGRFYDQRTPLILPPPVLYLEPEAEPPQGSGHSRERRRALLKFAHLIPRASVVTLWDASGHELMSCRFEVVIDDVLDPGPGGTVELRDRSGVTFMVGIPVRVPRIHPSAVLHLEPEEEWQERSRGEPRPRLARLVFHEHIADAAVVTLRDSSGGDSDTFPFQRERGHVVDPGPGGTVELRNRQGLVIMAGVPERRDTESGARGVTAQKRARGGATKEE